LRTQVIGLTDAWAFPDFVLKAPIAKYDGDIYQSKYKIKIKEAVIDLFFSSA
jgi:acyl-CoA oxidase